MKKSTLALSFILLVGLLIYSCTKENVENVERPTTQLDLTSPDGFTLATNNEELLQMLSSKLDPVFGKNYIVRIVRAEYVVIDDLTNAEVHFINFKGKEKSTMYYWLHESSGEESVLRSPNPVPVPDCIGSCSDATEQCATYLDTATVVFSCLCDASGPNNTDDCQMTTEGNPGIVYSCDDNCLIWGPPHLPFPCQVYYNPKTKKEYCGCPHEVTAGDGCGDVVEVLVPVPEPNPLPPPSGGM